VNGDMTSATMTSQQQQQQQFVDQSELLGGFESGDYSDPYTTTTSSTLLDEAQDGQVATETYWTDEVRNWLCPNCYKRCFI